MRSTKILSVKNRMVLVPNSQIGKNQLVNYSYPDPSYFNTLKVVVACDNDPDHVAKIILETEPGESKYSKPRQAGGL